jgi:nitrate/TMAO reductase-like tetraheme cytochrome c subunit
MKILNLPIWVWLIGIGGAVVVGLSGFVAVARYTNTDERFCLDCHRSGTNAYLWVGSKVHPADIACTECHARAGEIIPEEFRADETRLNENCERCHKKARGMEQGGPAEVTVVRVSHRMHLSELDGTCMDCHRNIVHDRFLPATNRPRMDYCYGCHEEDEPCTKCHLISLTGLKEMW